MERLIGLDVHASSTTIAVMNSSRQRGVLLNPIANHRKGGDRIYQCDGFLC
jgi:hypothetical protein